MNGSNTKKIIKVAVLIYLATFLIINWNDVSWIFNYKEVSGLVEDFFNPYPSIDASTMNAYFYPNHSPAQILQGQNLGGQGQDTVTAAQSTTAVQSATAAQTTVAVQPAQDIKTNYTDKQNTLEIPKISISVPIIFSTSTDKTSLAKDLDQGVVYYPGSVYPGQIGQIIILGHSAPPGWPTIKHDWVFTNLDKLSAGDTISIDLNNKQYTYVVKQKTIIQRGADVPADGSSANNNVLTLISCWPPGKDYQRITVEAELVNN